MSTSRLRFWSLHQSKVAALIVCGLQDARPARDVHGRQHYFTARINHTFLRSFDVIDREVVLPVRRNPFGHPRVEVIDEFSDAHTRLYRTDTMGISTFLMDAGGGIAAKSYATQ